MAKSDIKYNTIDYKDAFNHIRELANLEWNGSITLSHFRDRVKVILDKSASREYLTGLAQTYFSVKNIKEKETE